MKQLAPVQRVLDAVDRDYDSIDVSAALARVPSERLREIADRAVAALRRGADPSESQAARLVGDLSLQAPETLSAYLPELWKIRPNARSYCATWPWRGAGAEEIRRLNEIVHRDEGEDGVRAWRCLLQARTDEAWRLAFAAVGPRIAEGPWAAACIAMVGAERVASGGNRTLFSEATSHIVFPEGVLDVPHGTNPTWQPEGELLTEAKLGGSIDAKCKVCGGRLHRLLEYPTNREKTSFVTCLSCLGWSEHVLYFRHGEGTVEGAGSPQAKEPEFPVDPLPEVTVRLVAAAPRWRLQDWGMSNSRENLNRFGGEPTWIQDPEYPDCPDCRAKMRFAMQLDSLEFHGGPWWLWGSGGIAYAFWCESCRISATLWQCT